MNTSQLNSLIKQLRVQASLVVYERADEIESSIFDRVDKYCVNGRSVEEIDNEIFNEAAKILEITISAYKIFESQAFSFKEKVKFLIDSQFLYSISRIMSRSQIYTLRHRSKVLFELNFILTLVLDKIISGEPDVNLNSIDYDLIAEGMNLKLLDSALSSST